jgi:hypothetical protein
MLESHFSGGASGRLVYSADPSTLHTKLLPISQEGSTPYEEHEQPICEVVVPRCRRTLACKIIGLSASGHHIGCNADCMIVLHYVPDNNDSAASHNTAKTL